MPDLPKDIYTARGMDGQFVTVLPSYDLVVVRLGYTPGYMQHWKHQQSLQLIIDAAVNRIEIDGAIPGPNSVGIGGICRHSSADFTNISDLTCQYFSPG